MENESEQWDLRRCEEKKPYNDLKTAGEFPKVEYNNYHIKTKLLYCTYVLIKKCHHLTFANVQYLDNFSIPLSLAGGTW